MKPRFSIITACKGRLQHLRETLPRMIAQPGAEVVVVDYSCPDGAAAFVREHFPEAKVVEVEGEDGFSNWKARNAGAAAARGATLLFCDADTVLAADATERLAQSLPPRHFAHFDNDVSRRFSRDEVPLSWNQLKGFQVVPAAAFRKIGGYDELMIGYAAGADTDLEDRLMLIGIASFALNSAIVERVIEHGNAERMRFHKVPRGTSFLTGFIYRRVKLAMMRLRPKVQLGLPLKQLLYSAAQSEAAKFGNGTDAVALNVPVQTTPILMPRQLGFERVWFKLSLRIEVVGQDPVESIPE